MAELGELNGRLLVVYDGECGFCNRSSRWLLRRDRKDRLRFAPSTAPAVLELLANHGTQPFGRDLKLDRELDPGFDASLDPGLETVMVFRNTGTPIEELLVRSNAILACLRVLPQPWPAFAAILRLVPRPLRESAYRLIARNRYQIWGRYETCPIPTPEERRHFL